MSLLKRVAAKYWILVLVSVLVLVVDQVTKSMIVGRFRLGETVPVLSGIFNLTYVRNTGAAFGILHDAQPGFRVPFFMIVPITALCVIGYVFSKIPEKNFKLAAELSLIIGGAIGNLLDRLSLGYVVDFLDFHWQYQYHFPAFNVADSAICVGVGFLLLDLFFAENKREGGEINAPAAP